MALTMKQLLRRHGAFVSAVTALSVGAAILAQQTVQSIVSWVSFLPYAAQQGGAAFSLGAELGNALVVAIPVAVGFFLSLWLLAPIAEELRVGHVITRAILATGVASTLYFIVRAVLGVFGAFGGGGPLFGSSLVWPTFDGGGALSGLASALSGGILLFVGMLPLGVLAGVLLWLWRKDHPPKRPLSGLIDEI